MSLGNKISKDIYEKALNGEDLSLSQRVKAKWIATRILAKNYRLGIKTKNIGKLAYNNLCKKCLKKYDELCKDKYSDEDAFNMIKKGYYCEKCNPAMLNYIEHMRSIRVSDIKI